MKFNSAFVALAFAIASVNAAPMPALGALGRIGTTVAKGGEEGAAAASKGGSSWMSHAGNAAMMGSMAMPMMMGQNQQRSLQDEQDVQLVRRGFGSSAAKAESEAPKGNFYQEHASDLNNGLGMFNNMGTMAAAGINLQTSQDHRKRQIDPLADSLQRRVDPIRPPSRSSSTASFHTANEEPETPAPETAPKAPGYKTSDFLSSGSNLLGTGAMGMNLASAENNNAYAKNQSRRAIPELQRRELIGPWDLALLGASSSGVSVSNENANAQAAGSGNVKSSGAKSGAHRRSDEHLSELQRRLIDFGVDQENENMQSAGNGNQFQSGAQSGMRKRLIDVSTSQQNYNEQAAGNGNKYHSGAVSGFGPGGLNALNAPGAKRLFSVDTTDIHENQQSAGNENEYHSGAVSGFGKRLFSFGSSNVNENEQESGSGNMFQSGAQSGFGKRLFDLSTSSENMNEQEAGSGNMYQSGAQSGFGKRALKDALQYRL